jgi:toxin-antitoxin system PIN domain toxin
MTFFPDVNVWIALVVGEHTNAREAREWVDTATGDWLVLSRITQMGVLRLLTNPAVMGPDALSGAMAWRIIDELLDRENIRFVREPDGLDLVWRRHTPAGRTSPNFWTDGYLAAFAHAAGFTLVTFDRGFSKYRDIAVKILSDR